MKLADEYSTNTKYLIGPGLYDSYFSVLKLVIGIVASVLVGITLLEWVFDPPVSGELTEIAPLFSLAFSYGSLFLCTGVFL